jgi:hypothetical protein
MIPESPRCTVDMLTIIDFKHIKIYIEQAKQLLLDVLTGEAPSV